MADDLGGTTQDFLTLHQPHPAEPGAPKPTVDHAEAANRRMGRRLGGVGLTLLIAPAITVLLVLTIDRPQLELDAVNRFLAYTGYVTCTILGSAFIAVFFAERLQRYPRAQLRQLMLREDARDRQLDRLIKTAAAGAEQLAAQGKALASMPDYSQGVIDGARVMQSVTNPTTES